MPITAKRGGITASQWYETDIPVKIQPQGNKICFTLELDSKGGGRTDVEIALPKDEFEKILLEMLRVDHRKTVSAFSKALIAERKTATRG